MNSPANDGLSGKARQTLAMILNHVLEDECKLSATTRKFRWKVTGPNFHSLHRLFDEQRQQIDYWLDQVMARTRAIGVPADKVPAADEPATHEHSLPAGRMIGELLALHEKMARQLRADVEACGARCGDRGTADLLKRLVDFHETTAWMLRTLLDQPGTSRA
jgi:starvation-inducible DNA-binding protein